ncbi:MAG: glycosyltransferase, partial [Planctomycetota bacterium]|nr:glycosyltransferase [Planctomycetota bacterium]
MSEHARDARGTDAPLVLQVTEAMAGGVARHLDLIWRALPARGFAVAFAVSLMRGAEAESLVARWRAEGAAVAVVPMRRAIRPLADWRAGRHLRRAMASLRPALVHTHASKAGYLGRAAANRLGIPAVHTAHVFAFEWTRSAWWRLFYRLLERRASRWCQRIICLSEMQMEAAFAAGLSAAEKLAVIANGVDSEEFKPPSEAERAAARRRWGIGADELAIGTAARLEPQKGMGHFLRAAALISAALPAARFFIAGTGSLESECRRRTADLGLTERVVFCGNVADMPTFYHALDCFALTSLWEGLPYAILEAQASGLPVVASRTIGAEMLIVDQESGLLTPLGDEKALAAAVLRVLREHFTDWQVLLLTHDRVWYEISRQQLPGWAHA